MPGVREAIEEKNYAEADGEIVRVARALEREKALIDAAAGDLEGPVGPVLSDRPDCGTSQRTCPTAAAAVLLFLRGQYRRTSSGSMRCCSSARSTRNCCRHRSRLTEMLAG